LNEECFVADVVENKALAYLWYVWLPTDSAEEALRHDDQSEDQSVGLNFAIWSKDAQPTSSKYSDWYTADKEGAAKSIRDLYHVNATAR
jgi:hypothetical protein